MKIETQLSPQWSKRRLEKQRRLALVQPYVTGRVIGAEQIVPALEALISSGDRLVLEGNNQKQADFLSRALVQMDPAKVNHLHLIMPSVSLPEHLDLFELGIARKLDFAFAGT